MRVVKMHAYVFGVFINKRWNVHVYACVHSWEFDWALPVLERMIKWLRYVVLQHNSTTPNKDYFLNFYSTIFYPLLQDTRIFQIKARECWKWMEGSNVIKSREMLGDGRKVPLQRAGIFVVCIYSLRFKKNIVYYLNLMYVDTILSIHRFKFDESSSTLSTRSSICNNMMP
jgi:hypothetical protein